MITFNNTVCNKVITMQLEKNIYDFIEIFQIYYDFSDIEVTIYKDSYYIYFYKHPIAVEIMFFKPDDDFINFKLMSVNVYKYHQSPVESYKLFNKIFKHNHEENAAKSLLHVKF